MYVHASGVRRTNRVARARRLGKGERAHGLTGVILATLLVLSGVTATYAQFPAAGQDKLTTSGLFKFELLDGTTFTISLTGAPNDTVIGRSAAHAESAAADGDTVRLPAG